MMALYSSSFPLWSHQPQAWSVRYGAADTARVGVVTRSVWSTRSRAVLIDTSAFYNNFEFHAWKMFFSVVIRRCYNVISRQEKELDVLYMLWGSRLTLCYGAVYVISPPCVSVCPSVTTYKAERISSCFWRRDFPWLFLHCVTRKFGYLQKCRHFPPGTFPQTLDSEKYRHCSVAKTAVAYIVKLVRPTAVAILSHWASILTARCYASAVLAMGLCPSVSVCLSVTSRYSIETAERIELVLACELHSTRPTLC